MNTDVNNRKIVKDKNNKRNMPNPGKGIWIAVLLIACTALAAFYAYNHFMGQSTGDYRHSAAGLQMKIDKANSDFTAAAGDSTKQFDADTILKQLPKTIDAFDAIINDYNGINPPSSYSAANKKLGDSINLNKSIYQSLLTILKKPLDENAQKELSQLSDLVNQCMNGYATIGLKDINFSLPEGILSLPKRVGPWVSQKQADNSEVMKLIDSYTKYFDSMLKLFADYSSARTDFNGMIKNIRNNQSAWDDLFNKLDSSEKALNDIKTSYGSLNVPSELASLNKRFGPILDESILYLDKLRFAAQAEKNFSKEGLTEEAVKDQTEQINILYSSAEENNTNSFANYQKLASDMSSARDNYSDPDFVSKEVLNK